MKLYYTPTSPYVRKVLVAAHELGLAERITTELLRPSPMAPSAVLTRANPLSKIPALVLDDGETLFDSPVICEYLDSVAASGGGRRLVPASGPERWQALRLQALCDGILDAGVLVFYERHHRPPELQWASWVDGQSMKVVQGLDALEALVPDFGGEFGIGQITAGAALGWLSFRNIVGDWRATRPRLAAWFDEISARPSMKATEPH
ncbi:MAG: glutathione S-transferase N-terminal domain-containing protein [Myxococcota bacterium]